jgi:hypothetical protein
VEEILESVAGVPGLGHDQGKLGDFADGCGFQFCQRVLGRRDDHQFVAVNQNNRQTGIGDRHGHETEVHRIVDDRFQNLAVIGARDVDGHVRVLLLELSKVFGRDVQACAFISAHDDLSPGHALSFCDCHQDRLAGFKNFFSIFLEELAGGGDGNLSSGAGQLGADFFLRARICDEIAGCVRKRFSAAREKELWRATSRNVSSCSKSIRTAISNWHLANSQPAPQLSAGLA